MQARALWITEKRHAELRPVEVPPCGEGEILVQAIVSGISHGTEMVLYRGEGPATQPLTPRTSEGSWTLPAKYGYQNVGRVLEAGKKTQYAVGDIVFCRYPHQDYYTIDALDPELVYKLPAFDPIEIGILGNLADVSLSTLLDVPVRLGDVVAVFGLGVVGMFCAQFARRTASKVIVIDPLESRRALALRFGADLAVDPQDAIEAVAEVSQGRGADVTIEASGAPPALQTAIMSTGTEGTVAVVGWYGNKQVPLVLAPEFHFRRLRLVSSTVMVVGSGLQPRWDVGRKLETALEFLPSLHPTEMITHRIPFEQAPDAYRLIDEHPDQTLAVALVYGDH